MTFDYLEELAQSSGVSYSEFWAMPYRSLVNRIRGHIEGLEAIERASWERTRWQTAYLLNVYAEKGRTIKPGDLITFPWEKEEKPEVQEVDMALIRQRWAKWDKQINDGR